MTVHFINRDGEKITVKGSPGESLLDVVVNEDLDIDGFGMYTQSVLFKMFLTAVVFREKLRCVYYYGVIVPHKLMYRSHPFAHLYLVTLRYYTCPHIVSFCF